MTDDELGKEVATVLAAGYTFGDQEWSKMHDLERQLSIQVGRRLYDMGRQAAGVEVAARVRVTRPLSVEIGSWTVQVKLSLPGVPRLGDGLWLAGRACVVGSVTWRAEEPPTVSVDLPDATGIEMAEIELLLDGVAPWGTP
jgi:hypothetical protein